MGGLKVDCYSAAKSFSRTVVTSVALASCVLLASAASAVSKYPAIQIVDKDTARGVPLVRLCTTSNVCYWTDSNGVAVIDEPDFVGRRVFFSIESDGYRYESDVFGTAGAIVQLDSGELVPLQIKRINLAERLYRVTGQGIYRDSILVGLPVPAGQESMAAEATGMDTVMHTTYRNKIFWLFGDTARASAPLGNFATTCALTELPSPGTFSPVQQIPLKYFTAPDGFAKGMMDINADGLKWMSALMVIPDAAGREKLYARYDRLKDLSKVLDSGIAEFDDTREEFIPVRSTGPSPKHFADGRPTLLHVGAEKYFYFSGLQSDTPSVRVKADPGAIIDPASYEVFSCDSAGCTWKKGAEPTKVRFYDIATGDPFDGKILSLNWNAFHRKWLAVVWRMLGDVYIAEGDTPSGPWTYAQRVISHVNSTFYWPGQLAQFDAQGGRRIYIMGTYTQSFHKNPEKTPRYEYNQLLYALSLDSPDIALPLAHYRVKGRSGTFTKEQLDKEELWRHVEAVVDFVDGRGKHHPNHNSPWLFDRDARP